MSALEPRLRVALAQTVHEMPKGAGWAYEPKFDGHRVVVFAYGERVVLQARSGRIITSAFPDLAEAARQLPAGTVLDGEVVVWNDGRTDFAAVQKRAAAASASRAKALGRALPASYAAFDLLATDGTDVRAEPYQKRREGLVEVLAPLGPPLQAVPMTTDPALATTWYETLPTIGVEGLVIKRLDQAYPAGRRGWQKLRHTDTRDAVVVGFTGLASRPSALVLVLPGDDTPVVSSPPAPAVRNEVGVALAGRPTGETMTATALGLGEVEYRSVAPEITVEVRYGTTARHATVAVLRLRADL